MPKNPHPTDRGSAEAEIAAARRQLPEDSEDWEALRTQAQISMAHAELAKAHALLRIGDQLKSIDKRLELVVERLSRPSLVAWGPEKGARSGIHKPQAKASQEAKASQDALIASDSYQCGDCGGIDTHEKIIAYSASEGVSVPLPHVSAALCPSCGKPGILTE